MSSKKAPADDQQEIERMMRVTLMAIILGCLLFVGLGIAPAPTPGMRKLFDILSVGTLGIVAIISGIFLRMMKRAGKFG